jgi:D-amino-acid dehydrogenase
MRIQKLLEWVRKVLPQERFEAAEARPWCGLRPMSADGVPVIGATQLPNLLVNAGHGHLGWTLAAGSSHLLADIVCGTSPAVDADMYSLARFTAERRMA